MAKTINCLYFNARSIKNKFNTMKNIIKNKDNIIHFLLICETSLFQNDIQNYIIENYHGYFNCTNFNNGHYGTAIFIHKSINAILIEKNNYCSSIVVEVLNFNPKFHLAILYNSVTADIKNCIQHLNYILRRYKNLLVIADISIDLLKDTKYVKDYKKCISENGYNILNCIESKFGSVIDHVISNLKQNIEINIELSKNAQNKLDHYLFLLTLKEKKRRIKQRRIKRNYNIIDEHNYATTRFEEGEYLSSEYEDIEILHDDIENVETEIVTTNDDDFIDEITTDQYQNDDTSDDRELLNDLLEFNDSTSVCSGDEHMDFETNVNDSIASSSPQHLTENDIAIADNSTPQTLTTIYRIYKPDKHYRLFFGNK